jgi:diacylglycerol kinase family enzyme
VLVAGLLIVNPFASAVNERRLEAVRVALPAATEVVFTERPGHAVEIARDRAGDAAAVYVFAGDGTYNEVLNGLEADVPVGFLPGGGTSVLPRALGLPRDAVAAARRVAEGKTRRISLGRVNGRRFGFNAGLGFDAEVVRCVDVQGRRADGKRPGDLAFLRLGLARAFARRGRFPPVLELEGLGRAAFCLVANGDPYTYAGRLPMRFSREGSFERGLEVVAPVALGPLGVARLLAGALSGRGASGHVLVAHDADRLVVRCDAPLPLQADGEDLGDVESAVFEAERDAVAVLV